MTDSMESVRYEVAYVRPGRNGWGKGLRIAPTPVRNKVVSVTGGGIHPVAQRIADLTGTTAVDGFTGAVPDAEILCVVINCGGTARIGVYPRKKILTIDVYPGAPGGPLAQFITDDLFVSGVTPDDVQLDHRTNGDQPAVAGPTEAVIQQKTMPGVTVPAPSQASASGGGMFNSFSKFFVSLGSGIGYVVNTLLASGRQAITITLNTILPFMAYVSLLLGAVIYTGVANDLGKALKPLSSNPVGLIIIGIIVALPILSPILGPGAAVAQIIGVLMGTQIATRALPVQYALPTLFAIDGQVGCDFIPVGLGLGEAQPETVAVGTPAVLFSRQITSPLAVIIAYFASFGL
jgi:PTS system glucitol/sorbitol-specific IIB component